MTTIARRQVVGWGAIGLGAVALDGCGSLLPPATPRIDDVERSLVELDRVVLQLKSLEADPKQFGIRRDGADVASGRATCTRLLTTLCFMGTYRDVPETYWHKPDIERRLAETLPKIHNTIRAARNHLVELTAEEGARIDERLKSDPGLTMRILERVDDYAKQIQVPIEHRMYLRTATAELAGRFRWEGAKEVTSKLTTKYDRHLTARMSALGMQGDFADVEEPQPQPQPQVDTQTTPTPLRARFHTRAAPSEVHVVTCALDPTVTIDGTERPILLDWEEFRCPPKANARPPSDEHPPVRGAVHTEPGENGQNIVTLVLYPPDGTTSTDALSTSVVAIAQQIQNALRTAPVAPRVERRLGSDGESCRTKTDCDGALLCTDSTCKAEGEGETSSAKLITTTGKVAKWGAILLIPPLCFVGAAVLLMSLFMVIVAGCMYAAGD